MLRKHKGQPTWFHRQNCEQAKNTTHYTHTQKRMYFFKTADIFSFVFKNKVH